MSPIVPSPTRKIFRPTDDGRALRNPGMGWVFFHYDNSLEKYGREMSPGDTLADFPGLTTVYLRLAWAYLEPREGEFEWSVIDGIAQRYIATGHEVHLRFSCCESSLEFATPEWVKDAGAAGHRFTPGKGATPDGRCWEPDYRDPVFLEKLDRFLAAAAARYDDDAHFTAIDIGSFGVWGEGHTHWSTRNPYDADTLRTHIALHRRHFRRTLIVANDDFSAHGRGEEIVREAARLGLGLRDDSILVEPGERIFHSQHFAGDFWPTTPVILESQHYGNSLRDGVWGDGRGYLDAVEAYHASYVGIHWYGREFLAENGELVAAINRRVGYRLQPVEISWTPEVSRGARLTFSSLWHNVGVAPCLPGGFVAYTLLDDAGAIVATFVDESLDVRSLPVGLEDAPPAQLGTERSFCLPPDVAPGDYALHVSVGSRTGTPRLELPLANAAGATRRYRVGAVRVI